MGLLSVFGEVKEAFSGQLTKYPLERKLRR
jgi:hypothetical protein